MTTRINVLPERGYEASQTITVSAEKFLWFLSRQKRTPSRHDLSSDGICTVAIPSPAYSTAGTSFGQAVTGQRRRESLRRLTSPFAG
jgi:hypothetical protein